MTIKLNRPLKDILIDLQKVKPEVFMVTDMLEIVGLPHVCYNEDWSNPTNNIFTEKMFERWVCTDTVVGQSVIYMHGEPIAVTYKPNRKSRTTLAWIGGRETFKKVVERLMELYIDEEIETFPTITLDDIMESGEPE